MLNAFDTSERRREIGEHKQPQREIQETVGIIQRFVGWQVCVCVTFRYGWTGQQTCEVRQAPFSARQTNSIVIFLASLSFTYRPTLHRREHTTFTHTCLLKGGEKKNTEKEKKTSFFRRASKVRFALYVNKLHQLPYVSGAFFFFFVFPFFSVSFLISYTLAVTTNDATGHLLHRLDVHPHKPTRSLFLIVFLLLSKLRLFLSFPRTTNKQPKRI